MHELDKGLYHTLQRLSQGIPLKQLRKSYEEISLSYRNLNFSLKFSPLMCLSYAIARMPATLGVQKQVFSIFEKVMPLKEKTFSVIDIGSGPGTSLWSLGQKSWVNQLTLIEKQKSFIDLNKEIVNLSPQLQNQNNITYINIDINTCPVPSAQIALASYWINEISDFEIAIQKLWESSQEYIILIEPGTPQGFKNILRARKLFIENKAEIIAPCPSTIECPLEDNKTLWCHFRAHIPRKKEHVYLKSGSIGFEEEPYSYLIVKKNGRENISKHNRIISSVKKTKTEVKALLCTSEGLRDLSIPKRQKGKYKAFSKKKWGDIA